MHLTYILPNINLTQEVQEKCSWLERTRHETFRLSLNLLSIYTFNISVSNLPECFLPLAIRCHGIREFDPFAKKLGNKGIYVLQTNRFSYTSSSNTSNFVRRDSQFEQRGRQSQVKSGSDTDMLLLLLK